MEKRGKFLNKVWCCVGGEYNKIIWFLPFVAMIRSNEGLTLEKSVCGSLYDGLVTLSTQLMLVLKHLSFINFLCNFLPIYYQLLF